MRHGDRYVAMNELRDAVRKDDGGKGFFVGVMKSETWRFSQTSGAAQGS